MEHFDVKCPICGTVNKDLYLNETEGRYICECCHSEQQIAKFIRTKRIPLLNTQQLVALAQRR